MKPVCGGFSVSAAPIKNVESQRGESDRSGDQTGVMDGFSKAAPFFTQEIASRSSHAPHLSAFVGLGVLLLFFAIAQLWIWDGEAIKAFSHASGLRSCNVGPHG